MQVHDDRAIIQASPDELPVIDIRSFLTGSHATVRTAREKSGFKPGLRRREKSDLERG